MCGEEDAQGGDAAEGEGSRRRKLAASQCWQWLKQAGKLFKRSALPPGSERTPELVLEHLMGSPPAKHFADSGRVGC